MADRYLVASGNWNAASGVWAHESGGTADAAAPVNGDVVYMNAASGVVTVTLTAAAACTTLDCSNFAGVVAFGNYTLTVAGNVTFSSTMSTTTSANGNLVVNTTATITGGGLASCLVKVELSGTVTYTINAGGTTWAMLALSSGSKTITLQAALTCTELDITTYGDVTFSGAYDITTNNFLWSSSAGILKLYRGQKLVVNTTLQAHISSENAVASAGPFITSDLASNVAYIQFRGAESGMKVFKINFTDIDFATYSAPLNMLHLWCGSTLLRCNNVTFTVTAANATAGAVYIDDVTGASFTVDATIAGGTTLKTSCQSSARPAASGNLSKSSGTGDTDITYSTFTQQGIINRTSADIMRPSVIVT
jgi:hypothetical protein